MSPPEVVEAIEAVELVRVRLPLRTPLRSAGGEESARDVILVRVLAVDGVEGWGECPTLSAPTYTAEHTDGAWDVLRRHLAPALAAGRPSGVRGHPMARGAVADALADLAARRAGCSLAAELGGPARATVPSCAVVGVTGDVGQLLGAVAAAVAAGHRHVKVKVAPGWALEPLAAVREAWPDLSLAADANGSFPVGADTVAALWAIDRLELDYLEQPLGPDDLVASAELARQVATPLALDESITSAGVAEAAIALRAVDVVNVKPARVGGVVEAAAVVAVAAAHHVPAFVGGMLETGVGRAAALAVASLGGCSLPTDLGPSDRYFDQDVTDPFELVGGALAVPTGPGSGRVPHPERLAATAVDRLLLRADGPRAGR